MPPFPAPYLERRTFQDLPDEGSPLTETELLYLLRNLLQPLGAITYAFTIALPEMGEGEDTDTLVHFIEEILEQAVILLDAWHEHQPPPGRRRATPQADPPAAEPAAVAEQPDASSATPPRRRAGRSAPADDTDA